MRLILVSEFTLQGSGYTHIASNIGTELTRRGIDVHALAIGYKREQHPYPFQLNPVDQASWVQQVDVFLRNMSRDLPYDHVLVALDVPLQRLFLDQCKMLDKPVSGLFPLESTPVSTRTAMNMMRLRNRFVISKFGSEALAQAGVPNEYAEIPVDTVAWNVPKDEERALLRESFGFKPTDKIVLTVADNQERKNLSATLEIIQGVPEAQHVLVTNTQSPIGWDIDELLGRLEIENRVLVINKGIPFNRLWGLYAIADAFLITSKAEGLGIPVLEAMSMRVPVVAPNHTAFAEHLGDGRGYLFKNAFQYTDPFENQLRFLADVEAGRQALREVLTNRSEQQIALARAYVESRSWEPVGEVICKSML